MTMVDADVVMYGDGGNDIFGVSSDGAGDIDGDGLSDIVIGSYGRSYDDVGVSYVYLGTSLSSGQTVLSTADADFAIYGATVGEQAGFSVSWVGDQDGDGGSDLLIGAWKNDFSGEDTGLAAADVRSGDAVVARRTPGRTIPPNGIRVNGNGGPTPPAIAKRGCCADNSAQSDLFLS